MVDIAAVLLFVEGRRWAADILRASVPASRTGGIDTIAYRIDAAHIAAPHHPSPPPPPQQQLPHPGCGGSGSAGPPASPP
ncbi:hypothetical protein GCM10023144_03780 [Pigmentiphaga soli]|uniref:Uncharacterized protein n=1 Tax=Pigmentiphaga soli TaxID=1007095 RepID=A0ABP8GFJ1_9BURK